MGKRKKKAGSDNDTKRQKSSMSERTEFKEKETFTSLEFTQMLTDTVLYVKGLQRFCQASRLYKESYNTHDIVKAYISVSPECSEIFKCIERGKTSPTNVCLVFETLVTILLRTGSDLSLGYASVGVTICRRILQGHLRELYGALSLKNPARVIVPTLRMLTSMVMQNKECANDVANTLDLGGKILTSLAKYQTNSKQGKQKASTNIRLCLVRFVLSFFMSDDIETMKHVLETRGFVDEVFRGLSSDPASVIHIFLMGVRDKVIKNLLIPKTNKIKLLAARDVLNSVAELFQWDGLHDIAVEDETTEGQEKIEGKNSIQLLAFDFLFHCCCPHKYGINFRDKEYGTASRSQNHVLLKFLVDLKTASSDTLAHHLVVEILKSCPDLLHSYLTTCNLSFDPRPTEKWFNNCSLVVDIFKAQPSVPPAICEIAKTSQLPKPDIAKLIAMAIPGIVPSAFRRVVLKLALKHPNCRVQLEGCKILNMTLENLQKTIAFIETDQIWIKSNYSQQERCNLKSLLCSEISKILPDIGSLITIWSTSAETKDSKNNDGFQEEMLRILSMCQENLPEAFSQCQYDFSRLLFGLERLSTSPSTVLHAVKILSHVPHKYKWFKKGDNKCTSFYQLVKIITDLTISQKPPTTNEVLDKSLHLYRQVCIMNNIIDHEKNGEELVWIKYFTSSMADCDKQFLLSFFEELCAEIAKRPHRYSDKNMAFMVDTSVSDEPTSNITVNEEWWQNLPDVEIKTIFPCDLVTTPISDPGIKENTNCAAGHSMSLLLCAAFEWINRPDMTTKVADNFQTLDRYLVSVVIELYYHHSLSQSSDMFLSVVKNLNSELNVRDKLPMLQMFLQKHCLANEILESSVLNPIFASATWFDKVYEALQAVKNSKLSKAKKHIRKIENAIATTPEVGLTLNRDGHEDCSAFSPLQHHTFDTQVAQHMDFMNRTLPLCFGSSPDITAVLAKLLQHLMECSGKLMAKLDERRFIVTCSAALGSQMVQLAYLDFKNCDISALVTEYVNKLLLDLFAKNGNNVKAQSSGVYLERMRSSSSEFLCNPDLHQSNEIVALVWMSFDQLSNFLSASAVHKMLMEAIGCHSHHETDENIHIQIMARCLQILTKTCDSNPLTSKENKSLLAVLDCGKLNEAKLKLLHEISAFCTKFPSTVLEMDKPLLEWCLDHSENIDLLNLLKIIVQQNLALQFSFVRCIIKRKTLSVETIIPAVAMAIKLPVLQPSSEFFSNDLFAKFKKFLASSAILKCMLSFGEESTPGHLADSHESILEWAIETGCFHGDTKRQLEQKVLEGLGVNNFVTRWKVAAALLKNVADETEDNSTEFRSKLVCVTMSLSCDIMKSNLVDQTTAISHLLESISSVLGVADSTVLLRDDNFAEGWNSFAKCALKYQIVNPNVCEFLRNQILQMETANSHKLLKATTLFKMVTSHSNFLEIVLSTTESESHSKTSLLQLLLSLVQRCDPSEFHVSDYHYLLAAYNATLSDADQCILQILLLYEANGISTADCSPFLWGNTALESYQARKNMGETLYKKPAPNKVLACIDRDVMANSLLHFPIRRRFIPLDNVKENPTAISLYSEDEARAEIGPRYDPQFLLSVFSSILVPENLIDCRSILRQGALAFLLVALSSHCPMIRSLAAGCLARYYELAEPLWFSEKNLTLYLLRCVRNAAEIDKGSVRKISTIMGLYLAKMAEIMCQPAEHMYFALNRFLLVKPGLDLRHVPEFYVLFFSTDMEYKTERAWILNLLAQGVRDMGDYHVIQSRQLLRIMMTYYTSPTSDNKTRAQVLKVLGNCCVIRGAAFDLVYNLGLLPWLLDVVIRHSDRKCTQDGGSDSSKRRDPTRGVAGVLKSLWGSLAPNITHQVPETDARHQPAQMEEIQEESGIEIAKTDERTAEGRDARKRFIPVSLRLARQLINLSMELLSNLIKTSVPEHPEFQCVDLDDETSQSLIDVICVSGGCLDYLRKRYGDDVIGDDVAVNSVQARLVQHVGLLLNHNGLEGSLECVKVLLAWKHPNRHISSLPTEDVVSILSWTMEAIMMSQHLGHLLKPALQWLKDWTAAISQANGATSRRWVSLESVLQRTGEYIFTHSSDIGHFAELCLLFYDVSDKRDSLTEPTEGQLELFTSIDERRRVILKECQDISD